MTWTLPGAAGFVLAGGQSSRMGHDKALVKFAGKPMVAHALATLRAAGLSVQIAGARASLAKFAPVIADEEPGRGPLQGICSALGQAAAEWAVFLPVDLPLLPPQLVEFLLAHAHLTQSVITLASVNAVPQAFPVIIRRIAQRALESELRAGNSACMAAFQSVAERRGEPLAILPVELFVQSGRLAEPRGLPPSRWFLNVNTRGQLHRAEVLFA